MAATIPPALKAADIARFAQRAGQVEKAKPVVAYWCNYWIVEQILAKKLHKADADCMSYTMTLMDKLEQTKSDFSDNDAIMDDMAGQAYIEQFGQETFQRADNAMKASKASRQTADTFQAAATFLDLCQIWGPLDAETASKIKFAKYHALRIAKAIKANEDPNLSNPTPEPEQPPLDPNDPDVQMINGLGDSSQHQDASRQPSVVEIPDEHDRLQGHMAGRSTYDESLHPSRAPSVPPQPAQAYQPPPQQPAENYYHSAAPPEVSPLDPSTTDRTISDGGGYFPRVPDTDGRAPSSSSPDAPSEDPSSPPVVLPESSPLLPPTSSAAGFPPSQPPNSLHSFPPPNMDEPNISPPSYAPVPSYGPGPPSASAPLFPQQPPSAPRQAPATPIKPLPASGAPVRQALPPWQMAPLPMAPPPVSGQANYLTDEEAILKAQKHARWAISALNFEDASTAVKELRGALEALGAR
ncbi:hypothetical protein HO173_012811 [Letharia columbiana]|uniref:DUF605-domain-containing protein n=1 Tax=Letharia columbiana TaxID=112416 RepID=A0A8H6CLE1_9LECA|nr:uncharacterized protein HO173_012811 [Letharia columbiana]KAF6225326.1 hypothetical protein HO173_012811 [Letharia columbiana]